MDSNFSSNGLLKMTVHDCHQHDQNEDEFVVGQANACTADHEGNQR